MVVCTSWSWATRPVRCITMSWWQGFRNRDKCIRISRRFPARRFTCKTTVVFRPLNLLKMLFAWQYWSTITTCSECSEVHSTVVRGTAMQTTSWVPTLPLPYFDVVFYGNYSHKDSGYTQARVFRVWGAERASQTAKNIILFCPITGQQFFLKARFSDFYNFVFIFHV